MIGIEQIVSYVPAGRVSNLDRYEQAGKTREFIENKIGFCTLARRGAHEETSDLCVKAFERLSEQTCVEVDRIDCVVVCTQNPDGHGLPHTSAVVHGKLGLSEHVAAFDLSLGCSGYVFGLSVIQSFMRENGLRCGLLFTADPYSRILDAKDYDTELLFGDAASLTLMGSAPRFRTLRSRFASNGALRHSIEVSPETGKLSMQGNNVFRFTMTAVPQQIATCLSDNGLTLDDIDLFLFHQGSKFIVDNLAGKLGIPPEKAPFMARETGNTVSSTIPLMLERHVDTAERRILISGFGVGLSWGTSVLERL